MGTSWASITSMLHMRTSARGDSLQSSSAMIAAEYCQSPGRAPNTLLPAPEGSASVRCLVCDGLQPCPSMRAAPKMCSQGAHKSKLFWPPSWSDSSKASRTALRLEPKNSLHAMHACAEPTNRHQLFLLHLPLVFCSAKTTKLLAVAVRVGHSGAPSGVPAGL